MKRPCFAILPLITVLLMMGQIVHAFSLDLDDDKDLDGQDLSIFQRKYADGDMTGTELAEFADRYGQKYKKHLKDVMPTIAAYAVDGNSDQNPKADGVFDAMEICDQYTKMLIVARYLSFDFTRSYELRGLYEYELPITLYEPDVVIISATLQLNLESPPSGRRDMSIHAYLADGFAELADFEVDNEIGTVLADWDLEIDVTEYVQGIVDPTGYIGFIVRSPALWYSQIQNYAKFFNGIPHPAFGYISNQLARLSIEYEVFGQDSNAFF